MSKYPVHIVPVAEKIEAAIRQLADLDPDFKATFSRGGRVILKPNFVGPRKASTGATTSLVLIRELAALLKDLGAEPYLCESPGMEYTWSEVFEYLGIKNLARQAGIGIVECPSAKYVKLTRKQNRHLKNIRIPEAVRDAQILNLPKLKTHVTTKVTLGMKNLMGLCHDSTKRWMHVRGIEPCIADLNRILKPAYTIVDGDTAMEGDGGVYGNRRDLKAIVGGSQVVAVDQVCCAMIGVDYRRIPHIASLSHGIEAQILGPMNPQTFLLPRHTYPYHLFYRGLYAVDYLFQNLTKRHFNQWLYRTGYFGSRPKIRSQVCDRCEDCVEVCPTQCIDLSTFQIDAGSCIRCMDCFEICPIEAVEVRGFSRPHDAAA